MNLTLQHGCDLRAGFQWKQANREPMDCTGGSFAAEIRAYPGGPLLGTFTILWVDQATGQATLAMDAEDLNTIPDGVYRWDLVFIDTGGVRHPVTEGTVTKKGTITQV